MKVGFRKLGLGFLAALSGLMTNARAGVNEAQGLSSLAGSQAYGSPMFAGKSQRKGKVNKLRCSHNAKLKRRRN